MNRILSAIFCTLLLILFKDTAAQDTTRKTIEITSSFKPSLRPAEKLRFQATPPQPDTTRPRLVYAVPVINVTPALTPATLTPPALPQMRDSSGAFTNYVKLGYGNLNTPFVDASFGIATPVSRLQVKIDHISSSGKIENQDYSQTSVKGFGGTTLSENILLDLHAGYAQNRYNLFGYDRNKFTFRKEQLQQHFSSFEAGGALRNETPTEFGITYRPEITMNIFSDNRKNTETRLLLRTPVEKIIGKSFRVKIGVEADLAKLSRHLSTSIQNSLVQVPVSLSIRKPTWLLQAGLIPSWNNNAFKLLPDIQFNLPVSGEKWMFQAGWMSYFKKGDYRKLAAINPFLQTPSSLQNTRTVERFVGFKGTIPDHLTYSARVGDVEFHQLPLFLNDTVSGKSFDVLFEQRIRALQFQGEIGYIKAERFTASARFNWYKFHGQKTAQRPWSLIPLEISGHIRWTILNDLVFTTDLFLWEGPLYFYRHTGISGRSPGAIDLNAGLQFSVTKNISLWSQFNNVLNSGYQRWNQYNNYGFNMVLGGIFRFGK